MCLECIWEYTVCALLWENRVKHKEPRDLNQHTDGMDDRFLENDIYRYFLFEIQFIERLFVFDQFEFV